MQARIRFTKPRPHVKIESLKKWRQKSSSWSTAASRRWSKKNGLGIEIQVRDATLFAQQRGLFIYRFYRDEAESGVVENRPQLRKLLLQCKSNRVGTVIIPSLDRLSRDVRLAENLFWQFERCGVRVLIADMPNYNGQDRRDVLIRQIREAIAEDNRKEIIERLWKGRQERVRKGEVSGRERSLWLPAREKAAHRIPARSEGCSRDSWPGVS